MNVDFDNLLSVYIISILFPLTYFQTNYRLHSYLIFEKECFDISFMWLPFQYIKINDFEFSPLKSTIKVITSQGHKITVPLLFIHTGMILV